MADVDALDVIVGAAALVALFAVFVVLYVSRRHRRFLMRMTFEVERHDDDHEVES